MTPLASAPPGFRAIDPYEDAPPDVLFEVVNGVRVEKPMGVYEQYLGSRLQDFLAPFCRQHDLGRVVNETTFRMPGSGNDRIPDAALVSTERWPGPVPRVRAWPVAPDLAIEVISPSDALFDVFDKLQEYFRCGVRQVWLVVSNVEQVYVYDSPSAVRVLNRADALNSSLLPGFALPLADLFEPAEALPAG